MMGPPQVDQAALFYEFSLEQHVPATHVLKSIDRFVGDRKTICQNGHQQRGGLSSNAPKA
jgi:hypothetical protein